jgi:membrane-associated phospholipid phosphatase
MKHGTSAAALLLAVLLLPARAHAIQGWQETSGDVLTGVVPLTALYIASREDDNEGRQQWLWSTATALAVNSGLRYGLKDTEWSARPNGHSYGFPSGHVGFIGSGAAFLSERYGWKYGVPAWAATGYVAWVRVETDHHHWRDVIAGSLVAWGVSRIFVTPQGSLEASPVIDEDKAGLVLRYRFS